jgi:hypothetical protein
LQQYIQSTVKAQLGPQENILDSVLFSEMSISENKPARHSTFSIPANFSDN